MSPKNTDSNKFLIQWWSVLIILTKDKFYPQILVRKYLQCLEKIKTIKTANLNLCKKSNDQFFIIIKKYEQYG